MSYRTSLPLHATEMNIGDKSKRLRKKAQRKAKRGKFKNVPTKRGNKSCKQKGSCGRAAKQRANFLKF